MKRFFEMYPERGLFNTGYCFIWLVCLCFYSLPLFADRSPSITIIIDDLGHNLSDGHKALQLPGPITYAIIPFRPHTQELAQAAHELGKEIMVHMPMSSIKNIGLDKGGIHLRLNRREVQHSVKKAIQAVPYAKGMNNHMGSLFTQKEKPLSWVMDVLEKNDFYFVDSMTSPSSIAWHIAEKKGVPNLSRDFFLDNERSPKAIHRQFRKAVRYAEEYGHAVIIGHPYPETLEYLRKKLPLLNFQGVRLLSVSDIFHLQKKIAQQVLRK